MDFGYLPNIETVDFAFPAEHMGNVNILPGFPSEEFLFHVGFPIWAEKSWVGKIYPKGTKEKDYLKYYAEACSSIELNATHYNVPDETTIMRWHDTVPEHFRFCPKVPQTISHAKDMVKMTEEMLHFISAVSGLKTKLGTSFLQLPPTFGPSKIKSLLYFLNALPEDFKLAIELRHEDWFKDRLKFDKLFNYLEDRQLCAVITDVAGRRDVLHQRLSNRTAFIRFTANDMHPTDKTRINDWVTLLKKWTAEGLKEIYFFIHTANHAYCPELAHYFIQQYNPRKELTAVKQLPKQGSLFD